MDLTVSWDRCSQSTIRDRWRPKCYHFMIVTVHLVPADMIMFIIKSRELVPRYDVFFHMFCFLPLEYTLEMPDCIVFWTESYVQILCEKVRNLTVFWAAHRVVGLKFLMLLDLLGNPQLGSGYVLYVLSGRYRLTERMTSMENNFYITQRFQFWRILVTMMHIPSKSISKTGIVTYLRWRTVERRSESHIIHWHSLLYRGH